MQCLVFRREGKRTTLGHYLQMAAKATQSGRVVGSADVWDALDSRRAEMKRQMFILRVFQQIAQGLEFMHRHYKLHQSLGPESITLAQYNVAPNEQSRRCFDCFSVLGNGHLESKGSDRRSSFRSGCIRRGVVAICWSDARRDLEYCQ